MAMATTPMPAMPTPMVTMDTTARGPLMPRPLPPLRLTLMLTTAPMAMDWPTTDTAMDMDSLITAMPTMDTDMPAMPIPMPTTDTTARGPLTLPPPLMLTMELMAMAWPTTAMPTMDSTDIPTPPDTTDIINLLIFVKN